MGLFNKKEKYDIVPEINELKDSVCTCYSGRSGVININSKLVVPTGYYFIMGKKGQVLDRFSEGEHFFYYSNLPYACRRYKFNKKKDGKANEKFYCQYYFINKSLVAGQFKTYRKVVMGTKAYGIYKMHVYGMFSYKVTDCLEFMQSLLNEYDYIKTGEAEEIINYWVSELAVKVLEKNNFVITDIINNSSIITEKLRTSVENLFRKIGAELIDFKIYKYDLPKEIQKASDEQIKKQDLGNNEEDLGYYLKDLNDVKTENNLEVDYKTPHYNEMAEVSLQPNNNIEENNYNEETNYVSEIKNVDKLESYPQPESSQKTFEYKPFGSFVIENEEKGKLLEKYEQKQATYAQNDVEDYNFVDLENIYKNNAKNIKRCYNCGAENQEDATKCVLCGNNLHKGDEIYE